MIRICFHGAESTGKSTLIAKLGAAYGWPSVPEFGRTWAEEHGTGFTMADLLAMARGQDAMMHAMMHEMMHAMMHAMMHEMMRAAAVHAPAPPVLLLDTDPLMTAAWAQMLFGEAPPELFAYAKAEHYLLFAPDVPWIADGTRFFGTDADRARFADLCEAMLRRAGVPYTRIGGDWTQRENAVRETILAMIGKR